MRARHKSWSNGRYHPKKTCTIVWFEEGEGQNIRLQLEDSERKINVYPKTGKEADRIWFMFKQGAPPEGESTPFVADLLKLLKIDDRVNDYPSKGEVDETKRQILDERKGL